MQSIYLSYSLTNSIDYQSFIAALHDRLEHAGFKVIDPRMLVHHRPSDVLSSMQEAIRRADLMVTILGDTSFGVSFELGFAMGIGKEVLLVYGEDSTLPRTLARTNSLRTDLSDEARALDVVYYIQEMQLPLSYPDDRYSTFRDKLLTYQSDRDYFEQISAAEFEGLIFELFLALDYGPVRNERSEEQGYDFVLTRYDQSKRTLVEVKKYARNNKVGIGQVQQLIGAVYAFKADGGILISSSRFTNSAIDLAKKSERRLALWDLDKVRTELTQLEQN